MTLIKLLNTHCCLCRVKIELHILTQNGFSIDVKDDCRFLISHRIISKREAYVCYHNS